MGEWAVGGIFAATYLVVALGGVPGIRIDRTGAAIVGAVLMVVAGGLTLDQAWTAIDHRTLLLLFGMMVLIASLRLARFFRTVARLVVTHVRHPAAMLVAVVFTSGLMSALFVNDTICLVFTPILIEIAQLRRHRPLPYLLALATASNIGSVATITGNPQNMLIGSLSGISYTEFSARLAPVAIVGLTLNAAILYVVFRKDLVPHGLEPMGRGPKPMHQAMMTKSLLVAAGVLVGFFLGYDPSLVALAAAAVLLVTRRVNPEKLYGKVDWDLLVLFIGLFVVIAGVEQVGLVDRLFAWIQPWGIESTVGLALAATGLSNLISNVPAVMLFKSVIPTWADPHNAWLTLAMASTLAGNLTLVGSIANLIVLQGARRHGITITFWDYTRIGLPVTLATLAFGILWLG
ncbi:MAG: anion transporter [Acidimicrobiia bacterium]|nr:anion transporter [Acidimicrobiia bacterium]